jgi:hypothetical protein
MVSDFSATEPHSSSPASDKLAVAQPSRPIHPDSREASELLESLDDAMFTAICGEAGIVAAARELWMAAVASLPAELVEESREQYIRCAIDVTRRFAGEDVRDPAKVLVAVEIIELLTSG